RRSPSATFVDSRPRAFNQGLYLRLEVLQVEMQISIGIDPLDEREIARVAEFDDRAQIAVRDDEVEVAGFRAYPAPHQLERSRVSAVPEAVLRGELLRRIARLERVLDDEADRLVLIRSAQQLEDRCTVAEALRPAVFGDEPLHFGLRPEFRQSGAQVGLL